MFSKKILTIYLLLFSFITFAQWTPPVDPGFGGGTGDPATEPLASPIDEMIIPLVIIAIIVSFLTINKKKKHLS